MRTRTIFDLKFTEAPKTQRWLSSGNYHKVKRYHTHPFCSLYVASKIDLEKYKTMIRRPFHLMAQTRVGMVVVLRLLLISIVLFTGIHAAQDARDNDTIFKSYVSSNPSEDEKAYTEKELITLATDSQRMWNQKKIFYEDSYTYQYQFSSWTGFGTLYTVVVSEGTVVEFITESYERNYTTNEFIHHPEEIMTGDDIDRSKARTVDELYELCINEWLSTGAKHNSLLLGLSNDCLLTMCGYFPKGCADDCYHGIQHFKSFAWESMTTATDPPFGRTSESDEIGPPKCSSEELTVQSSTAVALSRSFGPLYGIFVLTVCSLLE